MERIDKILTQEEYLKIKAQITNLEFDQMLTGKNHKKKIRKLKAMIGEA